MDIYSTYSVKIKHYNAIFRPTVEIYRHAVDFFIAVALKEWDNLSQSGSTLRKVTYMERLTIRTKRNPAPLYPFEDADRTFYKFPVYLRRAAIAEAIGKISSYQCNFANWKTEDPTERGRRPSFPHAGYVYPALYRDNMYKRTGEYEAKIKVFVRNTWDWITIQFNKSDVDYITRHCSQRKQHVPTLQKRGREWFLDFSFQETVALTNTSVFEQTVVAVDLGINSAATVSVMNAEGAVLGRHFLRLSNEYDSLRHAVNRIIKAQQHGNYKTPRLWARAKGINADIAVKTASFIFDTAVLYNADVIVFEHLDVRGKKRGSKKQKLHMWRSQYVQDMVTDKAHRLGMRISHVCAWGTSRLAFDGSGRVLRGNEFGLDSYSMCRFQSGKIYNCDLNASYNIGSRYFIREIIKSLPVRERLVLGAKVPSITKRSTCTLSDLINMNAVLDGIATA